jgi:hypothetical protein
MTTLMDDPLALERMLETLAGVSDDDDEDDAWDKVAVIVPTLLSYLQRFYIDCTSIQSTAMDVAADTFNAKNEEDILSVIADIYYLVGYILLSSSWKLPPATRSLLEQIGTIAEKWEGKADANLAKRQRLPEQ